MKPLLSVVAVLQAVCALAGGTNSQPAAVSRPLYTFEQNHDPNGIGKFYMGREIAHVMGHEGADWLERPEREKEERPNVLIQALGLKPGMAVADIGAGTGFYTRRLAAAVGTNGTVFAVDIQPEMLDLLTNRMAAAGLHNVQAVLGSTKDPHLPRGGVDLVLMVDVYHEFDHPAEMMQSISNSLKPRGKVVFVEFRAEDPSVPIKQVHKMSAAQVRKEMSVLPLKFCEAFEKLPWQHVLIFERLD